MSIFGFFDFISAKILLPLGGLLISVYVAYIWDSITLWGDKQGL